MTPERLAEIRNGFRLTYDARARFAIIDLLAEVDRLTAERDKVRLGVEEALGLTDDASAELNDLQQSIAAAMIAIRNLRP